jgi:hypothetical protein
LKIIKKIFQEKRVKHVDKFKLLQHSLLQFSKMALTNPQSQLKKASANLMKICTAKL